MDRKMWDSKVAEYFDLFQGIRGKFGDERTALTILQEVNKDIRMAQIREERGNGGVEIDFPATDRQKNFLKKLGVDIPAKLSKKEASALIDEATKEDTERSSAYAPRANLTESWRSFD